MNILIRFLSNIFYYPLFLIGMIIPKSKNIWVFGSWFGNSYSDNPKYLFEYISNNNPEITPIWITKNNHVKKELNDKNQLCYLNNSVQGFYYTARASIIIVSQGLIDVNKYGIFNQKKILLWHGSPIKKIAYDDTSNAIPYNKSLFKITLKLWNILFPFEKDNWSLITAPSSEVKRIFISSFNSNNETVSITGYPRYDFILNNTLGDLDETIKNKKYILYAPTFRDYDLNYDYFHDIDFDKLNSLMLKYDYYFIVKLHPKCKNIINRTDDRLIIADNIIDINLLLKHSKLLITDYSSIYIDYLLIDKPIIFTPYDIEKYLNNRELYYEYSSITPGEKCDNWESTLLKIQGHFNGEDHYKHKRDKISKIFHHYNDTNNCSRIVDKIKEIND